VADAASSKAWVMVRKGDLALRDVAKRRLPLTPADVKEVRLMDSPRMRPARDLGRAVDARTLAREVRTKPTIGDFVPELRTDPKTTIPTGVPRSRQREDDNIRPREGVRTPPPESRDRQVGHPTDDRHGASTRATNGSAGGRPTLSGRRTTWTRTATSCAGSSSR
jgi:hypothetical protein